MTAAFIVQPTRQFERTFDKLLGQHRALVEHYQHVIGILRIDPYNRSRSHSIKKLVDVAPEEGQYRLGLGRWRFRYNIWEHEVELTYCGLRREDTYR